MLRPAAPFVLGAVVMYGGLFAGGFVGPPTVILDDVTGKPMATPLETDTATVESSDTPTQTTAEGVSETATPEPSETPTQTPAELAPETVEQLVHEELNKRRNQRNLRTLRHEPDLRTIARFHSQDMATEGYFSHEDPDGRFYADRYQRFNYDCRIKTGASSYATGGETIAYTYYGVPVDTPQGRAVHNSPQELATGLVNQWMNSTTHREIMLETHWENVGIGVAISNAESAPKVYVTANFC